MCCKNVSTYQNKVFRCCQYFFSGDVVMEEERKRLESLKHAATEASIMQWHEQRNLESHLRRRATLDSEEENMSTRSSGTPSDGDKIR